MFARGGSLARALDAPLESVPTQVGANRNRPDNPAHLPSVWLMMGKKEGENAQVLGLGEALGWPFEIKTLAYTPYEIVVNLPILNTLAGVVKRHSSPLVPPWPDIVISAGRRNEPVCRWIREQAGGNVRLIHVGRPWASVETFDLVVTTPQYRFPAHPKVVQNELPLHRVTQARLTRDAAKWAPSLAHLPAPYTAVLAGGNSGPYVFDPRAGARLARRANAMAKETGGSLLVTTSARTPNATADALLSAIEGPAFKHRWSHRDHDNPYFGILALADNIIVTADSVSMMAEACATGKPVYLFDTDEGHASMCASPSQFASVALDQPLRRLRSAYHLKAFMYRQAMKSGPRRLTRDLRLVHDSLVSSGRAAWLGEPAQAISPLRFQDQQRTISRVRALLDPAVAPQTDPTPGRHLQLRPEVGRP